MKLAVVLICVLLISSTGQTAQTTISDDISSRYRWSNHALFNDVIRNTLQTTIDSDSGIVSSYLYFYDTIVTWIKDTYRAWVEKDSYKSARLLLLSFGLVGLVGIRRRLKKSRSAQKSGLNKQVGS